MLAHFFFYAVSIGIWNNKFVAALSVAMDKEIREIRRQKYLRVKEKQAIVALNHDIKYANLKIKEPKSNNNNTAVLSSKDEYSNLDKKRKYESEVENIIDLTDSPIADKLKPEVSVIETTTYNAKSKKIKEQPKCTYIRMATYNIWFGEPYPKERMEKIASILTAPPLPNFVGFQEVTPELSSFLFPLLKDVGYELHVQENVTYGCAIAVMTRISLDCIGICNGWNIQQPQQKHHLELRIIKKGFLPYQETIMSRGLLWVNVELVSTLPTCSNSINILFTTTHLESYMSNYPSFGQRYDGVSQRQSQLFEAASFCESFPNVNIAVITGDLNWDDERKRTTKNAVINETLLSIIDKEKWKDAWLEGKNIGIIREDDCREGYTYDSKVNAMLRGNLRRRFDRCLYHFRRNKESLDNETLVDASLMEVFLLGKKHIEGLTYRKKIFKWGTSEIKDIIALPVLPSDHFGLMTFLKIKQKNN